MAMLFLMAQEEQTDVFIKVLRLRFVGGMDEELKGGKPAKISRNNQPDVLQMKIKGLKIQFFFNFNDHT